MPDPDYKRLIGEVAAKHGFRLAPDSPEWAIVTMSQVLLETTATEMVRQIKDALSAFEDAVAKVQTRAGASVAQEVRECAYAIRQELNGDIDTASLKAREIVMESHRASRTRVMRIALAASLIAAVVLILIGFILGRLTG